jgi:predicted GNAT superfamily acetyltransferase
MTQPGEPATMKGVTDTDEAAQAAAQATAQGAAETAARSSGVRIREIGDLDGHNAVRRLYDEIWRPEPGNPPVTTELLRGLTKSGNYVAGAFDGEKLLGAVVGIFGEPAQRSMHSHIAGVSAAAAGRNVGFALKLHQRAWALRRGVTTITWTYDPLVSRNAYFNLAKLAGTAVEYLPNFYGGMHDGINGDDDSDRMLVRWRLDAPQVVAACAGAPDIPAERARAAVIGLSQSRTGRPVAGALDGGLVLVSVPPDVESLRSTDPECARQWRVAVREAITTLLAGGARIIGFDRSGWYIADTTQAGTTEADTTQAGTTEAETTEGTA